MELLTHSDFNGFSATVALPSDNINPVFLETIFTGSVDIILSTGVTQSVFDQTSTAIKCIHYMESNNLYSLSPNEDITIINLRYKLLILENTYLNQKMMNSYVLLIMVQKLKVFIVLWQMW